MWVFVGKNMKPYHFSKRLLRLLKKSFKEKNFLTENEGPFEEILKEEKILKSFNFFFKNRYNNHRKRKALKYCPLYY